MYGKFFGGKKTEQSLEISVDVRPGKKLQQRNLYLLKDLDLLHSLVGMWQIKFNVNSCKFIRLFL